ncbi:NmrA family NAD(P)-binding protein [Ferroplasma acidarmanus]|uniref:NAD-dependent epimerase/dehydratase domain-containing protein n=1 Tax=Ferroplasma acidarmanus Fer1 TaxID=333146 RepID=S0AQJ9_FERAC|nr:NAD-dependent epimerase/dehydratase family protein [Ferroplasma acidarmanus]AGO60454.1 hypothetical protein FACI_IFERC00001G0474 [Ferroplasma acidarmanus Fer1]
MNNKYDIDNGLHVVIGATGAYGYAVTKILLKNKINVRAIVRNEEKALKLFPKDVDIVKSDIFNMDKIIKDLKGASVIYIANNFPYKNWQNYYISTENILKGAETSNSTVVFPGNVYGYGKFDYLPVNEEHPLNANGKKGILRNNIEKLLFEYYKKDKIGLVIPRFADFYGPNVTNDLYGGMFIKAMKNKKAIWPVNPDIPHNFTYIDDAAKATLLLLRNINSYGKVYHVSGDIITAREFINKIYNRLNLKTRVLRFGKFYLYFHYLIL